MEVYLNTFLTLALDGGAQATLSPEETVQDTYWVAPRAALNAKSFVPSQQSSHDLCCPVYLLYRLNYYR
jgi:hypothetical protein